MKRISELRGEQALDILADLIEPAMEIMTDPEVVALSRAGEQSKAISAAIKNHKQAVITVLALLSDEDPATYDPPLLSLPIKLLEILNDPDVQTVFSGQGQNTEENVSGSATVNIEETAEK